MINIEIMKASNRLIDKIKEFEGYKSKAYRCPAGVWTCGYGHTFNNPYFYPGNHIAIFVYI